MQSARFALALVGMLAYAGAALTVCAVFFAAAMDAAVDRRWNWRDARAAALYLLAAGLFAIAGAFLTNL